MNVKGAIKMLRTIQETIYLGNLKFYEAIDVAIKALEQQPEITYCKDCAFSHRYIDFDGSNWIECQNPNGLNRDVADNGFCYAGEERRTDG